MTNEAQRRRIRRLNRSNQIEGDKVDVVDGPWLDNSNKLVQSRTFFPAAIMLSTMWMDSGEYTMFLSLPQFEAVSSLSPEQPQFGF